MLFSPTPASNPHILLLLSRHQVAKPYTSHFMHIKMHTSCGSVFSGINMLICFSTRYLNKKLSYHRGTVQCAMLVNPCYVSRAMWVRKVSNSKSDLQSHLRALAMVPFNRPHTISHQSSIATMCLCCTFSEILPLTSQNLKRSRSIIYTASQKNQPSDEIQTNVSCHFGSFNNTAWMVNNKSQYCTLQIMPLLKKQRTQFTMLQYFGNSFGLVTYASYKAMWTVWFCSNHKGKIYITSGQKILTKSSITILSPLAVANGFVRLWPNLTHSSLGPHKSAPPPTASQSV